MNTASGSTKRSERQKKIVIAALAFLALWGFGTTAYLWSDNHEMAATVHKGRLNNERLLAEKLQLEKQIAEWRVRGEKDQEALGRSVSKMGTLRCRVEAAVAHSTCLEGAARKGNRLQKEVAALRAQKEKLESKLTTSVNGIGTHGLDRHDATERTGLGRIACTPEVRPIGETGAGHLRDRCDGGWWVLEHVLLNLK